MPANQTAATANLSSVAHAFVKDVVNITDTVVDNVVEIVKNTTESLFRSPPSLDGFETFFHNITRPTVDVDFAVENLVALPAYQFRLTLDAFDLFVQTQMVVSGAATYTLNLFTSESLLGLRDGNDLELGVVLTADLILSASGSLNLESGFHLRMDDGLALTVDLFGRNVSKIVCHGGTFEFLPVTVSSAALTLQAILRVGVHAGIVLSSDGLVVDGVHLATYSAGVETIAYADVANLTLNVAVGAGTNGSSVDSLGTTTADADTSCTGDSDVVVEGVFAFDIGAEAGASVQIGDFLSWGVNPTTMLPVFYTTVTQCGGGAPSSAVTTTPTPTPTSKLAPRATETAVETTVISTTFVYSAVACRSPGIVNCPASLQTTAVTTATSTTTLTVASGSQKTGKVTWPAPTATTSITRVAAFGDNAQSMGLSVSGTPTSFVPPPTSTLSSSSPHTSLSSSSPTSTGLSIGGVHLTATQEHIVIGATVGAGVPLVVGVVALIV